jgi:hypothetical protein
MGLDITMSLVDPKSIIQINSLGWISYIVTALRSLVERFSTNPMGYDSMVSYMY